MNYVEIRDRFLRVHGQVATVRELVAELEVVADSTGKMPLIQVPQIHVAGPNHHVKVPARLEVTRIESLLSQGANLAADQDSMKAIANLRNAVPHINQAIDGLTARLAKIGDDPLQPDSRSKLSAQQAHREAIEELLEARAEAVRRFKDDVKEPCRVASQAARQVRVQLQRRLAR